MPVPDQVKKQKKIADDYYANLENPEGEPSGEDAPQDAATDDNPQVEEPTEGTSQPETDSEDQQAAPEPDPAPDVEPVQGDEQSWEQKYRSLQGIFNAKMPALQDLNKRLEARITQLEEVLSRKETTPQQELGINDLPERLITQADYDEYTEESIDLMRRAAREEIRAEMEQRLRAIEQKYENQLQSLAPRLETNDRHMAEMRYDRFLTDLRNQVPDFEQLNYDQDFSTWLLQIDPLSGTQRKELLENAYGQYDVAKTAAFFEAFRRDSGNGTGEHTPAKQSNGVNSELAHQIAPGKGRTLNPTAAAGEDDVKYRDSDYIADFYDKVRKGYFRTNPDERRRIENRIFAATSGVQQ